MLVLRRGGNWSTRRKTSRSKGENQQQTQPPYGVDARIRTWATLLRGECPHHFATLSLNTPSLMRMMFIRPVTQEKIPISLNRSQIYYFLAATILDKIPCDSNAAFIIFCTFCLSSFSKFSCSSSFIHPAQR